MIVITIFIRKHNSPLMQRDTRTENKDPERGKRRRLPPESTNVRTNAFETKVKESNCKIEKKKSRENRIERES